VANHVEATGFERGGSAVTGVRFRDRVSGEEGSIRARVTINAAGPYADLLLDAGLGHHATKRGPFSRDACFVVPRTLFDGKRALAVQGATRDPEAHLSRGERHLFFAPWRGHTVIGVWHRVWDRDPRSLCVSETELQSWLDEINAGYPAFGLTLQDVSRVNCGLVPFGENEEGATDLKYGHRSALLDHGDVDGLDGLITIIGVRYTMGRKEAERVVDRAFRKLGRTPPRCRTAEIRLPGGDVRDLAAHRARVEREGPRYASPSARRALADTWGSRVDRILEYGSEDEALLRTLGDTDTIRAQVVHAVREEMAVTLADVLLRRTALAAGADPSDGVVRECAELIALEAGWDSARVETEISEWKSTIAGRLVPAEAMDPAHSSQR
jgi:glycerol-3-phosphate dehydrogenase